MSDWSNLDHTMHDLSLAQGNAVPARLVTVAGVGPPPPLHVEDDEGSEEQSHYESYCVGGGDFAPRDCTQIKTMLDLLKNNDDPVNSDEPNPHTPEFVPRRNLEEKIKINVAVSSITTAKEAELAARRPIPRMFKKSLSPIEVGNENALPSLISPERTKQYTPSTRANVYHSKYLKKSMLKEQIADDIWDKAEKQMKEIEERQRLKAACTPERRVATEVMLAEHRHLLTDECMVCIVAAKHGYYI